MIKKILKKILPKSQIDIIKDLKIKSQVIIENIQPVKSFDAKKTFTKVYRSKKWGISDTVKNNLGSSGSGSHNKLITEPYIELIHKMSESELFKGLVFVDLGCGDFNIGKSIYELSSKYIAVDVVKEVIDRNKEVFPSKKIDFRIIDIINEPLPEGDVCFIRQVLQHLSNHQIKSILEKLGSYKWVFITEHYPSIELYKKANIDKPTGHNIRLFKGSGVYLTEHPFSLESSLVREVLEVSDRMTGKYNGTIKTFLYKPNDDKHQTIG